MGVPEGASYRSELRSATWNMVREIRNELSWYFGIRTGIRGEGGNDILDLRYIEDDDVASAARARVEAGMRDRGWSEVDIGAGMHDWESARERLVGTVESSRDIEVTTRDAGGATLLTWETVTSAMNGRILHIYVNPLTYSDAGRMEASSFGASVAMGAVFAGLLHEPGHGDFRVWGDPPTGCFLTPGCDRSAGAIEGSITRDTDRILDILGLPLRGDYELTSPPRTGRDSTDPSDRTVELEDGSGGSITYPRTTDVRPDRRETGE